MELSEAVKTKLSEAVSAWADENLQGKLAVLSHAMYFKLEKAMADEAKKIEELFP